MYVCVRAQSAVLYTHFGNQIAIKAFCFTVPLVDERAGFGSKLLFLPGEKANKTKFKAQLLESSDEYHPLVPPGSQRPASLCGIGIPSLD